MKNKCASSTCVSECAWNYQKQPSHLAIKRIALLTLLY